MSLRKGAQVLLLEHEKSPKKESCNYLRESACSPF